MAINDLNPNLKPGVRSFDSRTLSAMDASPNIPRVVDNYSLYGPSQMRTSTVDSAALAEALTTPESTTLAGPSVGFNPDTDEIFINGFTFNAMDHQTALDSAKPELFSRTPTGLPSGFEPVSSGEYGTYLDNIRNPNWRRLIAKNWQIGVDNTQMLFGAGAAMLGDFTESEEGLSKWGRDVMKQQEIELGYNQPYQRRASGIDSISTAADWFFSNLAQFGPSLLESISAFVIGGLTATVQTGGVTGPVAGVAGGLGAVVAKSSVKKHIKEKLLPEWKSGKKLADFDAQDQKLIRMLAGANLALVNNYRTGVSDVYLEMLENAEEKVPGTMERLTAMTFGAPYALADTLGEAFLFSRFFNGKIAPGPGLFNRLKRAGGSTVSGLLAEGGAELAQEATVLAGARPFTDKELLTAENGWRLFDAFMAGAGAGGPIGGLGGLVRQSQEPTDILNTTDQSTNPIPVEQSTQEAIEPPTETQGELFPDADLGQRRTSLPVSPAQGVASESGMLNLGQDPIMQTPETIVDPVEDFKAQNQQNFDNDIATIENDALANSIISDWQSARTETEVKAVILRLQQAMGIMPSGAPKGQRSLFRGRKSVNPDTREEQYQRAYKPRDDMPFTQQGEFFPDDDLGRGPPVATDEDIEVRTPTKAELEDAGQTRLPLIYPLITYGPDRLGEFELKRKGTQRRKAGPQGGPQGGPQAGPQGNFDFLDDPNVQKTYKGTATDAESEKANAVLEKARKKAEKEEAARAAKKAEDQRQAERKALESLIVRMASKNPPAFDDLTKQERAWVRLKKVQELIAKEKAKREAKDNKLKQQADAKKAEAEAKADKEDLKTVYPGVDKEARELLTKLDEGAVLPALNNNVKRILRNNGVKVDGNTTPEDAITALREKAKQTGAKGDTLKKGKGKKDAIPESGPDKVDVGKQAEAGKKVSERNTKGGKTSDKKAKEEKGKGSVKPETTQTEALQVTPEVYKALGARVYEPSDKLLKAFPTVNELAPQLHKIKDGKLEEGYLELSALATKLKSPKDAMLIAKARSKPRKLGQDELGLPSYGETKFIETLDIIDISFKTKTDGETSALGFDILENDTTPDVLRDAIVEVVPFLIEDGDLNMSSTSNWARLVDSLDTTSINIWDRIRDNLKKKKDIDALEKVSEGFARVKSRILDDQKDNAKLVKEFPTLGSPAALAEKVADNIQMLLDLGQFKQSELLREKSNVSKLYRNASKWYAGTEDIKPDPNYTIKGRPLSDFFNNKGELKIAATAEGLAKLSVGDLTDKNKTRQQGVGAVTPEKVAAKKEQLLQKNYAKYQQTSISMGVEPDPYDDWLQSQSDTKMLRVAPDSGKANILKVLDADKVATPMELGRAKLLVKQIVSKYQVKPKVSVYRSKAHLRSKDPALYNRLAQGNERFETDPAAGAAIGDIVVLFTDAIYSDKQLKFTLAHEALGHFGLRAIVPTQELNKVLTNIYNNDPHIRTATDEYVTVHKVGKLEAIEEAIANHLAYVEGNTLAKIWEVIKKYLQKVGLFNDTSTAPYWVGQVRRYIRNGEIPSITSIAQIEQNMREQENSEVGRLSTATIRPASEAISAISTQSTTVNPTVFNKIKGGARLAGQALEEVQTLDNIAGKSAGIGSIFETMRIQASQAKAILSKMDGMLDIINRAKWWGSPFGKQALSNEEYKQVSDILAHSNLFFDDSPNNTEAKIREKPDLIIKNSVGEPMLNEDALGEALIESTLLPEQIAEGVEVRRGPEQKTTFRIQGFNPKYKLNADGTRRQDDKGQFIPDNRDALVYEAYVQMRKAINYGAAMVALGKYNGVVQRLNMDMKKIRELHSEIKDADVDVLKEIAEVYRKIYYDGATSGEGFEKKALKKSIADAEAFIVGITRAFWQDGVITDLKNMKYTENPSEKAFTDRAINLVIDWNKTDKEKINLGNIIGGLERMRKYNINESVVKSNIQQPLMNYVFHDTQTLNAQVMAKNTVYKSYVPFRRSGAWQLRFDLVDSQGNVIRIKPNTKAAAVHAALPYLQHNNKEALLDIRQAYADDLVSENGSDFTFQMPSEDGEGQVTFTVRPSVSATTGGSPTTMNMNYDDFASTLATLGVDMNLQDRESVVLALTRQHEKARGRLQKEGTPGWDDVVQASQEWLETSASIAAKNEYRHRIDDIMNDTSLWRGSLKKLKDLRNAYYAAIRTGNKENILIHEEAFNKYARIWVETADMDGTTFTYKSHRTNKEITLTPLGRGDHYKEKAGGLLTFYAQLNDIAVSAEDMLSKGPAATFKSAAVLMQLGGNIATGAINSTSLATMSIPSLATYNSKVGKGGGYGWGAAMNAIRKAVGNLSGTRWGDPNWIEDQIILKRAWGKYGLTEDEAQFLFRQTSRGVLDAALVNQLVGSSRGNFFKSGTVTSLSKKWMFFFAYTEQLNRRATALATYRLEKARRLAATPGLQDSDFTLVPEGDLTNYNSADHSQLAAVEAKVVEIINMSQGDYAMYNRPRIARGMWTQYIYIYKQFSVIATQLMRTLPPWGRVYYASMLIAAAGLKGLPGAEDGMDIVDTILKFIPNVNMRPVELVLADMFNGILPGSADYFLHGGLDHLLGGYGTVSTRMSLGDLFPMTGIALPGASIPQELKNFAGPLFSAAHQSISTSYNIVNSIGQPDALRAFIVANQNNPMAAIRALADTLMYDETGRVVNSKGQVISATANFWTKIWRLLGFYPLAATQNNRAVRMGTRLVEHSKQVTAPYVDSYMRSWLSGDISGMNEVKHSVRDHNMLYKNTPFEIFDFDKKIKRKKDSLQLSTSGRFLKSAPKNMQDYLRTNVAELYGVSDIDLAGV